MIYVKMIVVVKARVARDSREKDSNYRPWKMRSPYTS